MDSGDVITMFDEWIRDESPIAALVFRQKLQPVGGADSIVFPPTYTFEKTNRKEDDLGVYRGQNGLKGYNIDRLRDGTTVCLIDSEGSQANRMEPLFMTGRMRALVPQIVIAASDLKTGEVREVNLLEIGHRIADASVRLSDLSKDVDNALLEFDKGNAEPLARLAPTSIVFGAWDSRKTKIKIRALVRSVIRAYGVEPLHRSAQYTQPFDYAEMGIVDDATAKRAADEGMAPVPAAWDHGGVKVFGEIRREAQLSLEALRSLRAGSSGEGTPGGDPTMRLRRYILGIALAALTAQQPSVLRQGCQLVAASAPSWEIVRYDGTRQEAIPHPARETVLEYAEQAARAFGVGQERKAQFDPQKAKEALKGDRRSKKGKVAAEEEDS
jgi:CRISPR-associated protein Csb1